MFHGLGMNLGNLSRLSNAKSRSCSAENFYGEKGKAAMSLDGDAKDAARDLGLGWKVSPFKVIQPGETFALADIEGSGAIQSIWITGNTSRDFVIRCYWDDQQQPSVEVPLPDFFAFGSNRNIDDSTGGFPHINSIPVMVAPSRGLNCFWEMPFRKHAKITLENLGEEASPMYYQINYTLTEVPEDCAYFHAQFRRSNPLAKMKDHVILDGVKGKGHYVGTSMLIGLNGPDRWWGEGEVKFFMDGDDQFPTICGTGTEDYFGGAYDWSVEGKYRTYSGPFMGMNQIIQPDGHYISQQKFSMYRWHIMDPIRFETDLKVTIQDIGWGTKGRYHVRQDDIATVAYWYQTLPTAPFPTFPSKDELDA